MDTAAKQQFRLGVDVGGTFTDLLLIEEASGRIFRAKTLSTSPDPSLGVIAGIDKVCADAGIARTDLSSVMHGTTVATNAVLEGKGARVALLTTRGYRQVLHVGRGHIPGGLGAWVTWDRPAPPALLHDTVEVDERLDASGAVLRRLDRGALAESLTHLLRKPIDAIAICFLHSYANPIHEQRAAKVLRDLGWQGAVSLSSEVAPEQGEYERALTTVMNASVAPTVSEYCTTLERDLGLAAEGTGLRILRSDGGLMSVQTAVSEPVRMLLSGPAGGVAGAAAVASRAGYPSILTLDMGGTSTDVALIEAGRPELSRETQIGEFAVRASSVAVHTVGAGGGSIAHVPPLTGALRVGPHSAGATPGPAAYGRGGTEPTVTDANVVLGHLPPITLAGEVSIDRGAADVAIANVAEPLGLSPAQAAAGVIDIVNENMLGALRVVSIQRGFDPRDFALVAFGGAGGLHADALARLLGTHTVLIPPAPGVLCAYGDATTAVREEAVRAFVGRIDDLHAADLSAILSELRATVARALVASGIGPDQQTVEFQVDLRFGGQRDSLAVEIGEGGDLMASESIGAALAERLRAEHERLYGFVIDAEVEVVSFRAVAQSAAWDGAVATEVGSSATPEDARVGTSSVWFANKEWHADVLDRKRLPIGSCLSGPAIIVEADATTLVLPHSTVRVDEHANLVITPPMTA